MRLAAALALAALAALTTAPATALASELTDQAPDDGAALVLRSRTALRQVVAWVRGRSELLDRSRRTLPSREDKLALWGAWSTAMDHAAVLEARRAELAAWARRPEQERDAGLQVGRAAFLAAYRHGLELIALVERSPAAARILDEAVPELGLLPGTWARYKLHYLNAVRATEFAALETLARGRAAPAPAVAAAIEEDRAAIWELGKGKGQALTVRNAAAVVAKAGYAIWFPAQKGVSTWMGDTRVRRGDSALVSPAQIAALPGRLLPGDVLLERREWFLSNLGLPGFWTHAALYVGTPEERRAFFDDAGVRALAREEGQPDGDLDALLAAREPAAAAASRTPDAAGHPPRVLEAISEGVSFTTLEHSAAADSIAVLRPRLDRRARAVALLRAFHYAGRPYDFDFDFLTDASLVCSELVYKAYEPGPGMPGVRFPLEELVGRRIATPNGMARQYDAEAAAGAPQLELVVFLDGAERSARATEASPEQFRRSWKRPKWHAVVAR